MLWLVRDMINDASNRVYNELKCLFFIWHFTDSLIYCFTLWFRQLTKFISFSYFNDTPIFQYSNYKITAVCLMEIRIFFNKKSFQISLDKSNLPMNTENNTPLLALTNFHMSQMCLTQYSIFLHIHDDNILYSSVVVPLSFDIFTHIIFVVYMNLPSFMVMHAFVIEHNVEIKSIYCMIWEYLQAWKSYSTFWLGAV